MDMAFGADENVAPFTGAWIETKNVTLRDGTVIVAPFTGAWIETATATSWPPSPPSRPLHGGVD